MSTPKPDFITVVSGLPRSGTSMMMRMLAAAGVPILTDRAREADADNPHGYFELEAVKRTRSDPSWLADAAAKGCAVKVIHVLLPDLPSGTPCRVIMMHRDLDEVIASQRTMLKRSGRPAPAILPSALKQTYAAQLRQVERWLRDRPEIRTLHVSYSDVLSDPHREAVRVAEFLDLADSHGQMAAAVDPALYRSRRPAA